MMYVKCKTTLYKNIGDKTQKETFTIGKMYKYYDMDSVWQQRIVEPNEGPVSYFNEDDFYKYFYLTNNKL